MMEKWESLANDALKDPRQPITADTTNVAKYGAAGAALVTTLLTGILGSDSTLDFSRGEVVVAAAVIVASVLLGVYHAFATDLRTRGAVAVARIETLGELARQEMRRDAACSAAALDATTAAEETAAQQLANVQCELRVAQAELKTCRDMRAAENGQQKNAKPSKASGV